MRREIFKKAFAIVMIAALLFTDFISLLPGILKNNKLAENFRVQEAQAAVSIRDVGSYVSGTANLIPAIPATAAAGDMMLLAYGTKPYNDAPTIDQGWISIGSATDGTVAAGIDVGSMQTRIYYKIHSGVETNPTITNTTNNVSGAVIIVFQKASNEAWVTPVGAGGGDAAAGTGFSVTASANPGITAGDILVGYAAINSDAGAQSTIGITATGLTLGVFTEYPASDLITTSGGDMAMSGGYRLVTAGTASAAPVYASTLAASNTGSAFIVRLRTNVAPTVALNTPADLSSGAGATPTLNFIGTDAESDAVEYNVQISTNNTFGAFVAQGAGAKSWYSIAADSTTHDVYAIVNGGDIYKQTAGSGAFVAQGAGTQFWYSIAADFITHDVYAVVTAGDIYKQTAGSGAFMTQSAGAKSWYSIAIDSTTHDVYAVDYNGDIYKQTAGSGAFVAQGAGALSWYSIAADSTTHDVYATVNGGDIYKQTAGSGAFVAQGAGAQFWYSIAADFITHDVYAVDYNGDIYKQTAGSGAFVAQGAGALLWNSIAVDSTTHDVYAVDYNGDIYKQAAVLNKFSATDTGFTAGHPFASGSAIDYTVQAGDALPVGTYYWRVRAIDPTGSNIYGAWSSLRSFTITEPAPDITAAPTSGQVGSTITVSGTNFGATAGTLTINNKIATVGSWSATSLTGVVIPGQEGAANITGKIQITRASDSAMSNLYPAGNFTILSPSVSGSTPATAAPGQTLSIEFSGVGIDTNTGTAPILKLTKTGQTDIVGTGYTKVTDYQAVSATFNLTGAAAGYWNLVIVNSDTQSGSYGNGTSTGFYIIAPPPTVTGISPVFGTNNGIASITSVSGTNFQSGAIVKLTKAAQTDIAASTAFTFTSATALSSGAFDLTSKTLGWWNVVVTNPDAQSASYGDETSSGFEIRSTSPSAPANIYQFETNTDTAQPPTTNIAVGGGIGGQTNIYFRMDMEGGLTGELYYPQVELKPIGTAFTNTFTEGAGVTYNGTAVKGWVNITAVADGIYHWQARVRNSAGTGSAASFGGNTDPSSADIYMDNTAPTISLGTDNTCGTAAINITDLGATIKWSTVDAISGLEPPPGSGAYATAQVQYIKTSLFTDWTSTPGTLTSVSARENSPHQIVLSGLLPATGYTYRIRSKDAAGNEAISTPNCTFTTSSSRPSKTIELFIGQETGQNTGAVISKNFSVYIPESPSTTVSVLNAFIEITGVTDATANQTINVGLLRGTQGTGPAGENYAIDATNTNASFTILFDALNPSGTGQQNMSDIIYGASTYNYTLFLNGTATPVSAFSAKLILTYDYVP